MFLVEPIESPLLETVLLPARGHMAFESCVEHLGSAIQLGIFKTGERLPSERDLAERMQVSRATLREAISALRAAGFVTTVRGRGGGTIVEPVGNARPPERLGNKDRQEEISDILIFRSVIEPGACQRAASMRLSEDQRRLLTDSLAEVENAGSPVEYRQADARLHLAFSAVAGSSELNKASTTIQTKIHEFLAEIPFLQRNIEHSNQEHRLIVQAILDGEPATARSVMELHCESTAALLKGLLK